LVVITTIVCHDEYSDSHVNNMPEGRYLGGFSTA
jgi:hypothetical protein